MANRTKRIQAITDPVSYNKDYTGALTQIKTRGESFIKDELSRHSNSGLSQDQINDLVGRESYNRFQIELQALNEQYPFRNLASDQILANNAPKIARTARSKPKTTSKKRTVVTAPKKAPARKKTTRKKQKK